MFRKTLRNARFSTTTRPTNGKLCFINRPVQKAIFKQITKLTPDNIPLNTPGVSAEVIKSQPVSMAQSGLTRTEEALLSNEEKAIKLRSKGITT